MLDALAAMRKSSRSFVIGAAVAACGLAWTPSATGHAQVRCEAPRVLISLDKSSSMLGRLPGGGTKWDAARTALRELVEAYADRIDFGLQIFPHPNECAPGRITLDIGPNDAARIVSALGAPPPEAGNWTPMAQSLDALLSYERLRRPGPPAHVILITDGWQWCSPYDPATRFLPVDAVGRLRAAGLTVHVVGFGASVDPLTLNRAAVAAGTARPGCNPALSDPAAEGHCYAQVDDLSELRAELDAIARSIADETCNGVDDDCDGVVDDGFDADGDGQTSCGGDCDDTQAAVRVGATEACNGVDDDCDGVVDPGCECLDGQVRACGSSIGACVPGEQRCAGGAWGACEGGVAPASRDACDGRDDDCDGAIDEEADACGAGSICVDGACVPTDVPPASTEVVGPQPEDVPPADVEPEVYRPNYGPGCICRAAGYGTRGGNSLIAIAGLGLLLIALSARHRSRR
ncbi:MAG: VWA domain-containing protein [Myxococcota bacterium]|nr:VWA domain-containing protein [Myxococcota bacterium]MDW8363316.1 vWA domain-containing protein [Myxococcales bacterium]